MTDVHDKKTRSYNMSQIKSKDTKPEILVRKFLFSNGYRFRLHKKNLPGKPDIVLQKYRTVIYVNGCFWHGHSECKYFVIPKTRTKWWMNKINKNKENDVINCKKMKKAGWHVLNIFECKLRKNKRVKTLNALIAKLY